MEDRIKEKINILYDFLTNDKPTVEACKDKIYELFEDSGQVMKDSINEAYYKCDQTFLSVNNNNLYFIFTQGGGDISHLGPTHSGMDITIASSTFKFPLFSESEFINNVDLKEGLQSLLRCGNITIEDFKDKKHCSSPEYFCMYNGLDSTKRNDIKIMDTICKKIYRDADLKHEEEIAYMNISPFGGVDVTVRNSFDYFFEKMGKFAEINREIMDCAIDYIITQDDYLQWANDALSKHTKQLYYIAHKKEYDELFSLENTDTQKASMQLKYEFENTLPELEGLYYITDDEKEFYEYNISKLCSIKPQISDRLAVVKKSIDAINAKEAITKISDYEMDNEEEIEFEI